MNEQTAKAHAQYLIGLIGNLLEDSAERFMKAKRIYEGSPKEYSADAAKEASIGGTIAISARNIIPVIRYLNPTTSCEDLRGRCTAAVSRCIVLSDKIRQAGVPV